MDGYLNLNRLFIYSVNTYQSFAPHHGELCVPWLGEIEKLEVLTAALGFSPWETRKVVMQKSENTSPVEGSVNLSGLLLSDKTIADR